ncbi:hypothetical protein [Helicobacter pylori]|uniref:hypothetical protein n=1 Tax=Helicobacter pylori TaxID=210 RepID=UPI00045897A2|nr:hypothetical protein [Helicobacter pylori]AHZ27960.1 hypothetical protein EG66_02005 [Helicobacter pylori]
MIDCKNESTWALLKKDYDDFTLLLILSFLIVLYLQKSLTKAIFKSSVVLGTFLVLDMSCYQIGYIKGLFISLLIGTQLENIYQLIRYYVIEWLHNKKQRISEILEIGHIEIDDDIKDKPNKTE